MTGALRARKIVSDPGCRAKCVRAAALLVVCAYMAGCSVSGKGLAEGGDPSMTTASVSTAAAPQDNDLASDRQTVQNAVSAADLSQQTGSDLAWANSSTGSNGVVSSIVEVEDQAKRCRRFQTTRTSYAGIAIHEGEICAGDDGMWWTKYFKPI